MSYLFIDKVGKMGLDVWLESAVSILTVVFAIGLFPRKFIFKSHQVTPCFTDEFFELVGCLPFLTHSIFTLKVRTPSIHKLIPLVPYRLIPYVALTIGLAGWDPYGSLAPSLTGRFITRFFSIFLVGIWTRSAFSHAWLPRFLTGGWISWFQLFFIWKDLKEESNEKICTFSWS